MKKRLLTLLLMLVLLSVGLSVSASAANYSGVEDNDIAWEYDSYTRTLTVNGSGPIRDYEPTLNSESMPDWDKFRKEIQTIIIGEGITCIGGYTFQAYPVLTKVEFPSTLKEIRYRAFDGAYSLAEVDFPEGLEIIGTTTFVGSPIKTLSLPDSVREIGALAFAGCPIEEIKFSAQLAEIGNRAFSGCTSLREAVLPASLETMGDYVFEGCTALETVSIPAGVTKIGLLPFSECPSLKTLTVDPGNAHYCTDGQGVLYDIGKTRIIQAPASISGTYTMPNTVTAVESGAFKGCSRLTKVDFSSKLTSIGEDAFYECTALTEAMLPDTVTDVGEKAFILCTGITQVHIPEGLQALPLGMFSRCTSLTSVSIPANVISIGDYAFSGCTALRQVQLSEGLTEIGGQSFYSCCLEKVEIPKSVTSMTYDSFYGNPFAGGCEKYIVHKDNPILCSDSNGVLYNKDMTTLIGVPTTMSGEFVMPRSVTSVAKLAFMGCGKITGIGDWGSVNYVGSSVFVDCDALTDITLPETLTEIPEWMFGDCDGLTTVVIPDRIKIIGDRAFKNCDHLISVEMTDHVKEIRFSAFENCTALERVKLSAGVKEILSSAFRNCSSLKEVVIPEGVERLWWNVFCDCSSLTKLTIPASLEEVFGGSFYGCDAIAEIYYGSTEQKWLLHTSGTMFPNAVVHFTYGSCEGTEHTSLVDKRVEAVCVKTGLTEGAHCSICGEVLQKQEVIPATGVHTYEQGVCSGCGGKAEWWFDEATGTLTVSMQGPMPDYNGETDAPWDALRGEIKHVILENGVTCVGNAAFSVCSKLETVAIPQSVTRIGEIAFQMCESLVEIKIPEGVKEIGMGAFNICTSLTVVDIPASVLTIGDSAFGGCEHLTAIRVHEDNPSYCSDDSGLLFNKNMTELIAVPNAGITECYIVPKTVKRIGPANFNLCPNLKLIFYEGSEAEWDQIEIGFANTYLEEADKKFGSSGPDCASGAHYAVIDPPMEPNCVDSGLTEGSHCAQCGVVLKAQEAVPALGHAFTLYYMQDATCTENGLLVEICRQGAFHTHTVELAALGHDFQDGNCVTCGMPEETEADDAILERPEDPELLRGDMDGSGTVDSDDAIYLLRHTLKPSAYPISQSGDVDGSGAVDSDDAIYLLRYTLKPSAYPLHE